MLVFDIETNGLLKDAPARGGKGIIPALTRVHCAVTIDTTTGRATRYRGEAIESGLLPALAAAEVICGHNALSFDLPALHKVYPQWQGTKAQVRDTLLLSTLNHSALKKEDFWLFRKGTLPGELIGSHSLEAWGYRLGILKGTYAKTKDDAWSAWSEEMEDYCEQDVRVTVSLMSRLEEEGISKMAEEIEHEFRRHMNRMEDVGVGVDELGMEVLEHELRTEMEQLRCYLKGAFGSWTVKLPDFIPKRNNKTKGYVAGVPVPRQEVVEFEPKASHIVHCLKERYGWKPTVLTETGKVKCDEAVLASLPDTWVEVPALRKYATVQKKLGFIARTTADAKSTPLCTLVRNGRVHGSIKNIGAVSHRCAHRNPNLANIPKDERMRKLFVPRKGWKLVGCDAAGIQARMLAHYIYPLDDGAMAKALVEGKKEDGTDIHTINQKIMGVDTRDIAKSCYYALLFDGQAARMAAIAGVSKAEGQKILDRINAGMTGFAETKANIEAVGTKRGYLFGLDKRRIPVESAHFALCNLLQGAEAVTMKLAINLCIPKLAEEGIELGRDYEVVLFVHDEYQFECRPEVADRVGQVCADSITRAGEILGVRCKLEGEYDIGDNWSETH